MLLDAETRRRGETRGEHLFRIGFRACKATQESQNLPARRQRRSYRFAARLTLGWKADQRSARRIPQLVRCISMLAGGGKTGTQYRISANFPLRPPTVPSGSGSRGVRGRGGAEKHAENIFSGLASELARLRRKVKTCERGDSGDRTASQRGSRWGGRLTNAACWVPSLRSPTPWAPDFSRKSTSGP